MKRTTLTPTHLALAIAVMAVRGSNFVIILSMWLTGERLKSLQVVTLLLAIAGLAVILRHIDGSITPFGLGLLLIAALGR